MKGRFSSHICIGSRIDQPCPCETRTIALGGGGGMSSGVTVDSSGDSLHDRWRAEDLIFHYVKFLLRPFLQRDRHRAREKMRLRTIDGLPRVLLVGSFSREPFPYLVELIGISYLGGIKERTDRSRMGGRRGRSPEHNELDAATNEGIKPRNGPLENQNRGRRG